MLQYTHIFLEYIETHLITFLMLLITIFQLLKKSLLNHISLESSFKSFRLVNESFGDKVYPIGSNTIGTSPFLQ